MRRREYWNGGVSQMRLYWRSGPLHHARVWLKVLFHHREALPLKGYSARITRFSLVTIQVWSFLFFDQVRCIGANPIQMAASYLWHSPTAQNNHPPRSWSPITGNSVYSGGGKGGVDGAGRPSRLTVYNQLDGVGRRRAPCPIYSFLF